MTSVPGGTTRMLNFKCMCKSFEEQVPDCQKYISKVTKRFVADFTYMTIFGMFLMQGKDNLLCSFGIFNNFLFSFCLYFSGTIYYGSCISGVTRSSWLRPYLPLKS